MLLSGLRAQTLEVPEITSVSVDFVTGKPVVSWEMQLPELVDGYIVKRLFVDGDGVIHGTYNNVAVIESNYTFSYVDESTAFGTEAKPGERQEFYRVSAFKYSDGQTHYSLMSDEVSTISLSGSFNECNEIFSFQFSEYLVPGLVDHYALCTGPELAERLVVTKETNCHFKFLDFEPTRQFAIECVLTNGESAFSPIINVNSTKYKLPDVFEISSISSSPDNKLQLTINVENAQSECYLILMRSNHDKIDTISLDFLNVKDYVFTDETANSGTLYDYRILMGKRCGGNMYLSNQQRNVVLEVLADEQNGNALIWNKHLNWNSGVEGIEVYRSIDGSDFESLATLGPHYVEYSDNLSNQIANSEVYCGKFCYQVLVKGNSNYGYRDTYSNIACINHEPVIYIPNALNPKSVNSDNWEFKPKADFLDDYKLVIYDKRGVNLFESDDISKGWDGYDRNGKLCVRDTYVYVVTFRASTGKLVRKTGPVNLVY